MEDWPESKRPARSRRRGKKPLEQTELPSSWISLEVALSRLQTKIQQPERATEILAAAIVEGTLTVLAGSVVRCTSVGGWGEEWSLLLFREASQLGYAKADLSAAGRTAIALDCAFWKSSQNIPGDQTFWNWEDAQFYVGRAGLEEGTETSNYWEISRPTFLVLEIDALIRRLELRMLKLPSQNSGGASKVGRPRISKWDAWTAHLIDYFHHQGIEPDADPSAVVRIIDGRLADEGKERVEPRDALRTVEAVIAHLAKAGKPQDS